MGSARPHSRRRIWDSAGRYLGSRTGLSRSCGATCRSSQTRRAATPCVGHLEGEFAGTQPQTRALKDSACAGRRVVRATNAPTSVGRKIGDMLRPCTQGTDSPRKSPDALPVRVALRAPGSGESCAPRPHACIRRGTVASASAAMAQGVDVQFDERSRTQGRGRIPTCGAISTNPRRCTARCRTGLRDPTRQHETVRES